MITVELVDKMGTDLSAVNAARVSFDKKSDWEYTIQNKFDIESGTSETVKVPTGLKLGDEKLI